MLSEVFNLQVSQVFFPLKVFACTGQVLEFFGESLRILRLELVQSLVRSLG